MAALAPLRPAGGLVRLKLMLTFVCLVLLVAGATGCGGGGGQAGG